LLHNSLSIFLSSAICDAVTMAAQLVVRHTFWELESPEELALNVEERRNRAYTDMCIDYRTLSKSMDMDSSTSTVTGSSVASSNASPSRSAAGSEAGDTSERWADITDDDFDDVPARPAMTMPAGTWFVPVPTIWFQGPPGMHHPVSGPMEAQVEAAFGKTKAVKETKTARTRGKPQTAERQPQPAKTTCSDSDRTTLVFRKLPADVSRTSLLEMLDEGGLRGLYDFVYLPMDFKKGKVFGYAIVNFIDHACAEQATVHFGGADANIDWSDSHQGVDELIQRYRDSPIMHSSMPETCKPIIFSHGAPASFPLPTKNVKTLSKK